MTSVIKPAAPLEAMASRPPAVAGQFYPDDPGVLRREVQQFVFAAGAPAPTASAPKALIAPHAGYVYSGRSPARRTRGCCRGPRAFTA